MKHLTAWCLIVLSLSGLSIVRAADGPKPAAEPKLPGAVMRRADGRFLNLKIEDHHFVVVLLDEKKRPEPADLQNGIAKYRSPAIKERRAVFAVSDDGQTLMASQVIRSPYAFKVNLVLYKTGHPEQAETYVTDFNQPMPDDGKTIPVDEMTPEQLQQIKSTPAK